MLGKRYTCGVEGHSMMFCPKGGQKGADTGGGKAKGFQGNCHTCGVFGHSAINCWYGKGKGGKGGAYMLEWEGGAEEIEEEEDDAQRVEEACTWVGSVIGDFGGCRVMSEDVDTEAGEETIEMVVDSGCRRSIVKPKAFIQEDEGSED